MPQKLDDKDEEKVASTSLVAWLADRHIERNLNFCCLKLFPLVLKLRPKEYKWVKLYKFSLCFNDFLNLVPKFEK